MINYKHLHYFWAVAREGGIARASERLHLTPQTISGQLSLLEEYLGIELFTRVGRNLELTEHGRLVSSYADEIFSLGGELEEVIHQLPVNRPHLFRVGVVDMMPKSISVASTVAANTAVSSLFGYISTVEKSFSLTFPKLAVEKATKMSPEPSLLTDPNRPSASEGRFARRCN